MNIHILFIAEPYHCTLPLCVICSDGFSVAALFQFMAFCGRSLTIPAEKYDTLGLSWLAITVKPANVLPNIGSTLSSIVVDVCAKVVPS